MEFELTRELQDQIMYAMENQNQDFLLDTFSSLVVTAQESDPDPGRYIELPAWQSADGFYLMEKFVSSLRNPIFRESLRIILASGKGVFRKFKNTLKERCDMEKLWFKFKEREMRNRVIEWYNQYCELWGIDTVEYEPEEETQELVLSDFVISEEVPHDYSLIRNLDRDGIFEFLQDQPEAEREYIYDWLRKGVPDPEDPGSRFLLARTLGGDFAGFLWMIITPKNESNVFGRIIQLYILPEYRGLGLAETVLDVFTCSAVDEGVRKIFLEFPGCNSELDKHIKARGFSHIYQILSYDPDIAS